MLDSGFERGALATLLTALPKPGRPPDVPENLRPISVSNVWYRVLMKVFVLRLKSALPSVLSCDQHGFAPGRSCTTAVATLLPILERAGRGRDPAYLLTLDLDKAYDRVHRASMDAILRHVGVADNAFYRMYVSARDAGYVYTGGAAATSPFTTSVGIRQGCPASPTLFAILMSGLERRLART